MILAMSDRAPSDYRVDEKRIAAAVREILAAIGEDPNREGLKETPRRVANMYVELTAGVLWALSLWGFAHMAGGLIVVPLGWPVNADSRVLYALWLVPDVLKYDHVVHAYGFGTTTWVCWQGLRAALRRRGVTAAPTLGLMVLSAAAGLGFGALNEVVEFAATLLVPETNVGGYLNTGWDLVANSIGVTVAATLIWWSGRVGGAAGS